MYMIELFYIIIIILKKINFHKFCFNYVINQVLKDKTEN